jgi:hypothetical protein
MPFHSRCLWQTGRLKGAAMWLITEYEAVTLFSLRLSSATASGGKTLLIPTPYAIKMALLDAACRISGVTQAEDRWPYLRDLKIALSATEQAVISNVFQKVLRPRRNAIALSEPDAGTFQKTIGYREYVHLVGPLGIALGWDEAESRDWLDDLLLNVNYFGKRGSFMQLIKPPARVPDLPADYVEVTSDQLLFAVGGTLQVLDDCTSDLTFEKANIYSDKKMKMGKERITRNVVLPYRLTRSSKSFSLYERL